MGLTFNPLNPLLSLLVLRNPLELDSKVGLFKPKKRKGFRPFVSNHHQILVRS